MTQETNWFKTGSDGYEEKKKLDAIATTRKERGVPRFRIAKGEEADIVFVDSAPFFIHEHVIWTGNSNLYLTCTKDFQPCAVCEHDERRPIFTAYLTVIDTREFTRKSDGKITKNRRILFPAKGPSMERIKSLVAANGGDITGLMVKAKRYGDKEPNCGSDFLVLNDGKRVDVADSFEKDFDKPFEYRKLMAPATEEELANLGYRNPVKGSSSDLATDAEETNLTALL